MPVASRLMHRRLDQKYFLHLPHRSPCRRRALGRQKGCAARNFPLHPPVLQAVVPHLQQELRSEAKFDTVEKLVQEGARGEVGPAEGTGSGASEGGKALNSH